MERVLTNLTQYYKYINEDLADPRTKDFTLTRSPAVVLVIIFLYHRFVREWGPKFMANRPPYEIKTLIAIYNAVQIYLCGFLTYKCITLLYMTGNYSMWCQGMSYDDTPLELTVVNYVWLYYAIKLADLIDTVFFVLRKKFNHISFLHVYHHMGMCLLGYVGTKYVAGGHGVMLGCINSLVHTVMYSYYLVAVVRPEWVRIWWKKYITQLQILQFLLLILHFGHVLFEPSCGYPKWVSFMFLPHNIFILYLFCDFYVREYMYKKQKKT